MKRGIHLKLYMLEFVLGSHYDLDAVLPGSSGHTIPGAIRSQWELSLFSPVGLDITAPTYVSRHPGSNVQRLRWPALMTDAQRKAELRKSVLATRRAIDPVTRRLATHAATDNAWHWLKNTKGLVGLYAAFQDEMDAEPLAIRLAEAGRRLALPFTPPGGKILVFRVWTPGDKLITSKFGIAEPGPDQPEAFPDVLVIAPVAFDRRGYRIGYGAGFYDRTIPTLKARHPLVTLGFGFACQEIAAVPDEHHDVPLDGIATEKGTIEPIPSRPGMD